MKRENVKRLETLLCCIAVCWFSALVMMLSSDFIMNITKPTEISLYKKYGKISLIYLPTTLILVSLLTQFFIGGVLFRKNKPIYGLLCTSFPISIIALPLYLNGFQINATITIIISLILASTISYLSGLFFGTRPSPIPSLNRQTGKQANRQTGKQANRQTGKQANRQTGKQANRQTGKQANRQTGKQANRSVILREHG
ncbi:hypothetical protein [Teredinibacter sp. KSP-S5-2]|uniref:hypothetical protein n=1 Tax=Teredinibacter sp. KSP-S5-2 TaxID=3034506 RepID=UPI002934C775|nr:hypothetical protein [Teredinibacter sp. KSP-S5-2]WNO08477.1 hypothetical protein P5V12_16015 [Teredinibacter sp. KSP-S5-2]